MKKGFTLLELIIVIVILGILATLGYTQYSKQVESTRLAEAKVRIGLMQKLAYEYYVKNGSVVDMQNSDVDVDNTCSSASFYRYRVADRGDGYGVYVSLAATRCTNGGKVPDASREYTYYIRPFFVSVWPGWENGQRCYYTDDGSSCFGFSSYPDLLY